MGPDPQRGHAVMPKGARATLGDMLFLSSRIKCVKIVLMKLFFVESFFLSLMFIMIHCYAEVCI